MKNKLYGNFLYEDFLNTFEVTEESVSKRSGINFDRLSHIVHARVAPTRKEKISILAGIRGIPKFAHLEMEAIFPTKEQWLARQEAKEGRQDRARGGVTLAQIREDTRMENERREVRRKAREAARQQRISDEQNNFRSPTRIPSKGAGGVEFA